MENKEIKAFRQGELLFIPVSIPKWARENVVKNNKNLGNVIREGEVSGHKHEVEGNGTLTELKGQYLYENSESVRLPDGEMFLTSDDNIVIKHPEHNSLKLAKGDYVVRIQREYDEIKDRYVND